MKVQISPIPKSGSAIGKNRCECHHKNFNLLVRRFDVRDDATESNAPILEIKDGVVLVDSPKPLVFLAQRSLRGYFSYPSLSIAGNLDLQNAKFCPMGVDRGTLRQSGVLLPAHLRSTPWTTTELSRIRTHPKATMPTVANATAMHPLKSCSKTNIKSARRSPDARHLLLVTTPSRPAPAITPSLAKHCTFVGIVITVTIPPTRPTADALAACTGDPCAASSP